MFKDWSDNNVPTMPDAKDIVFLSEKLLRGTPLSVIFKIPVEEIKLSQENNFFWLVNFNKINGRYGLGDFLNQNIKAIRILNANLAKYNISKN